ncbi:MAG: RluA family pseudouridine synthase [Treponema sp.]|jgi:23S rRNA pseudouridine1911/1915/1917 synthase|nr:RluA family pseudouridine synthase [Treponema sp.]
MPSFNHTVTGILPAGGMRLDRYIAENLGLLSRSQIKARELKAAINGKEAKISRTVKNGDLLELVWQEAQPLNIIPENIPLDIMYEDERTVVINKAPGMVVHPGAGNRSGTLANALYYRRLKRGGLSGTEPEMGGLRPGIVHRLDKETSGVIIAAYDDEALAFLAHQFKSRKAKKTYIAIVNGIPKEKKGRIETFIARDSKDRKRFAVAAQGRLALTYYSVIKTWRTHSLILLRPKTGRTHQLRVHLRYLGNPITGDPLYGFTDDLFPKASLMLHAKSLAIILPGEDTERVFKSPLPERFTVMIHSLNDLEAQHG